MTRFCCLSKDLDSTFRYRKILSSTLLLLFTHHCALTPFDFDWLCPLLTSLCFVYLRLYIRKYPILQVRYLKNIVRKHSRWKTQKKVFWSCTFGYKWYSWSSIWAVCTVHRCIELHFIPEVNFCSTSWFTTHFITQRYAI